MVLGVQRWLVAMVTEQIIATSAEHLRNAVLSGNLTKISLIHVWEKKANLPKMGQLTTY